MNNNDIKIKVILVEDDDDFAFLVKKMITANPRLDYLGRASGWATGVEMAQTLNPQITLMDLNLSGSELDGIEAAKEIRLTTNSKVILLTSYEQPEIVIEASKKSFASGYLFKSDCQNLADTIYKTAISATPQEQFIKELVLSELTAAERGVLNELIAANSDVLSSQFQSKPDTVSGSSPKTIANQKTSIFRKLGVRNTGELVGVFRGW
ncbi:MAG: response regulator [Oscillospiraceae bacterium]|nr:response regulator [Oscillospiraceae bacterium]